MTTHLLYLHGFRSSPQSFKARRLQAWLGTHRPDLCWWCPQLPPSPREAYALIDQGTCAWPAQTAAVVGSSLGGFYATVLASRRGWRCAVINPAVDPERDLAAHIGEHAAYHDATQRLHFQPAHVEELRTLSHPTPAIDPQRTLALIATGDEVLDWHEMRARYAEARVHVVEGSDHGLSDFDEHLPVLLDFLGLA
jgi:predicted esterase YcpF (UPF0227 family)